MTGRTFKILLADDDPDDRDLFEDAISEANADLDSVPNGTQLMKTLDQVHPLPDFVMLDLNMPEKSGKDCLQEIRNHDRLKNLPVVIYSTSSSKKDIDDTFALGANLYVTKPNSFLELKKMIAAILKIDWAEYHPGRRDVAFVLKN